VKSRFWYTDPAAPCAFTTVIFRFPVAQAATPPAEGEEAACGDDAELGVEEPPEAAPEAADEGAAAEVEAEEAAPAGGAEDDDPPDEHPATAATAATATAAPLSLNDTDSNMIIRPFW
jgi:hypothetical protein